MINREKEDRLFYAEVMVVYRMCHGDRYVVERILRDKQQYRGEVFRIIGQYEGDIETPALISHWPTKEKKYGHKL